MINIFKSIYRKFRNGAEMLLLKTKFYITVIKYTTPNLFKPHVPISEDAKVYLKELSEKGFFIMEEKFTALADYINKEYFENFDEGPLQKKLFEKRKIRDINSEGNRKTGNVLSWYVSFMDPKLEEILFHKDLCGIYYNYFRRQPYYRDSCHLTMDRFDADISPRVSSKYHLDQGVHQLSIILLLKDITINDTHTLYAEGSHKVYRPIETLDRNSFADSEVEKNWKLVDLHGKKGSLLVMDAGNGFHKIIEKPNSTRKMLFINVTAGSDIKPNKMDTVSGWQSLKKQELFIQRMFKKTCEI
jgi:hypothetical protein